MGAGGAQQLEGRSLLPPHQPTRLCQKLLGDSAGHMCETSPDVVRRLVQTFLRSLPSLKSKIQVKETMCFKCK